MDLLVSDVLEKEASQPQAPSFPQLKTNSSGGFPGHKKRARPSAFKQKRQGVIPEDATPNVVVASPGPSATTTTTTTTTNDKDRIDRENTERLASMSPEEIEAARQELFSGMNTGTLERLLRRANLDDSGGAPLPFEEKEETAADPPPPPPEVPQIRVQDTSVPVAPAAADPDPDPDATAKKPRRPKVTFEDVPDDDLPTPPTTTAKPPPPKPTYTDDTPIPQPPTQAEQTLEATAGPGPRPHFPAAPQPPDLDPTDPDFLPSLHAKYFPSLPADPSKLAWMAPVPTPNSPADLESPYHPSQPSLPASSLRFDFRGSLLPPRIARAVPSSKGLHHHAEAPEAAGYTVRELSRLARSAVPGQRCLAYQTLGRVLFRLGRGQFGRPGDDLADGVWAEMSDGAVLRCLYDEAGDYLDDEDGGSKKEEASEPALHEKNDNDDDDDEQALPRTGRGHRSAHVFAVEAIWLFEKGGWKEKLRRAK